MDKLNKATPRSPGERLTDVIFDLRTTKKAFAQSLGYNPSYVTQICLNIKKPSREFAKKVERLYGIPADWLFTGSEEAPASAKPSMLRKTLLSKISRIDSDYELRAVLAFLNSYEELQPLHMLSGGKQPAANSRAAKKPYYIPIKGEVAGGSPIIAYEQSEESVEAHVPADSALYLRGRSMEPSYPDGSLLLVRENVYVANGDVVIALIMNEAEVAEATCKVFWKRGGLIRLTPLNPDFPVQTYTGNDGCEIKIFGKVIGVIQ